MTERRDDISGLHSLKGGHSYLPAEGPDVSILEAFPNRFPERRYVVSISFPEFTSLCPVTGQALRGVQKLQALYVCLPQPPFLHGDHYQ